MRNRGPTKNKKKIKASKKFLEQMKKYLGPTRSSIQFWFRGFLPKVSKH